MPITSRVSWRKPEVQIMTLRQSKPGRGTHRASCSYLSRCVSIGGGKAQFICENKTGGWLEASLRTKLLHWRPLRSLFLSPEVDLDIFFSIPSAKPAPSSVIFLSEFFFFFNHCLFSRILPRGLGPIGSWPEVKVLAEGPAEWFSRALDLPVNPSVGLESLPRMKNEFTLDGRLP